MTNKVLQFTHKQKIQTQNNTQADRVEVHVQEYVAPAYRDFILAKGLTPYIVVSRPVDNNWSVPDQFVRDDSITLNLSVDAAVNQMCNNGIFQFSASFGGVQRKVWFYAKDIVGVYAKENHGLAINFVGYNNPGADNVLPSA